MKRWKGNYRMMVNTKIHQMTVRSVERKKSSSVICEDDMYILLSLGGYLL